MTKHGMAWHSIAWGHTTVGFLNMNFQVKMCIILCDNCNTPIAAPQGAVLQSFQHLSLSVELIWHLAQWHSDIFLLVFLFKCTSGETLSFSLCPSAPFALLTRVKISTRRLIFPENCLLYRLANIWPYVTRYIKRKRTNRLISSNQKCSSIRRKT